MRPVTLELRQSRLFFDLDDFLTVISSASFANSVRQIVFSAFRALYHAGEIQLPYVGASPVTSCLRYFSLRYSHVTYTSRDFYTRILWNIG